MVDEIHTEKLGIKESNRIPMKTTWYIIDLQVVFQ